MSSQAVRYESNDMKVTIPYYKTIHGRDACSGYALQTLRITISMMMECGVIDTRGGVARQASASRTDSDSTSTRHYALHLIEASSPSSSTSAPHPGAPARR